MQEGATLIESAVGGYGRATVPEVGGAFPTVKEGDGVASGHLRKGSSRWWRWWGRS